jgi:HAD superfamily hydrolase (TIGR01509 family)
MKRVVLFDFHNTLVTCDSWLELEIRTLPGLVLRDLARRELLEPQTDREEEAVERFKLLRQEVRESGVELSALDGVMLVLYDMGIEVPKAEVERAVREREEACLGDVEILPGATEALEQLHDAGCLMGVVSSAGYPPFVELALELVGLRSFFNEVITSSGEGIYKSNPEIYRRAVQRLGAKPEEAVHVGDHPAFDVEAARKAGLDTIWLTQHAQRTATVRREPWRDEEVARTNASVVITGLDELFGAIKSL